MQMWIMMMNMPKIDSENICYTYYVELLVCFDSAKDTRLQDAKKKGQLN